MDEDDDLPRGAGSGTAGFEPRALDRLSIAELEAYIALLEAEIARVRADIAAKRGAQAGADAVFRR